MNRETNETNDMIALHVTGEMEELTRNYDWSKTPIGHSNNWPLHLKNTVEMILSSGFPMFLWWGEDLIQFYNDAYRPSFGNEGKHPTALGQKGCECWPEIWHIIHPLIEQVRTTGRPTWSEDQLVPIYRNGRIEDVYWTFGYSAIKNETGAIDGVLVVCHETTEKVKAFRRLAESEKRFRTLVSDAIMATAVLTGHNFKLELANKAMLNIWARDSSIIGRELLEFMPELKDQSFPSLLTGVLETGAPYVAEDAIVYLQKNGKMETVYMDFSYQPLRIDNEVTGVLVMAVEVTERVLAKKHLEQSEQNLRNTILKAPVAMCIFRGEEHVVEIANEQMTEFWGKPLEDVINKPIFEGLPEAKDQGFENMLKNVFTTGETFSAQDQQVTLPRNGKLETVYVNFVYAPYRNPDGKISGIIAVAVEVTEQALANKKIQENEQRTMALLESAPFPIAVYVGKEMRIEMANQSIIEVWGKGNDVVGKTYFEILPELESQQIYDKLDQVYTTGNPFHARNQRVDLVVDGTLRPHYFNYSFTPLIDVNGNVYGVMNTAAEVTDLHVAKQKTEQSEKNFRSMILQAPVAMCILLGPEHIIEVANDPMIELWGKGKDTVMGKPVFDALPDAKEQGLEQLMTQVYISGETFTANEMPVALLRNGKWETVYQNFVYEPYRDSDGSIRGVLAISIDVSAQVIARREIEEIVAERTKELAAANTNLLRSNSDLEQFAYIASHDLQEPIRKVSIYTQMLEKNLSHIDERSKNYLGKIKHSSSRMLALIRDVLAYSEVSKIDHSFETVNLQQVVAEVTKDFELLIEQKKATVITKDLPVIEAIPLQISQLFGNLVSNALKYTKKDTPPIINITAKILSKSDANKLIGYAPNTTYYHIEVEDNGIGFNQEDAARIFHIFQRLHGKNIYEGTGIGLSLCQKIVQNHGGEISAFSEEDKGSTFVIILPEKWTGTCS